MQPTLKIYGSVIDNFQQTHLRINFFRLIHFSLLSRKTGLDALTSVKNILRFVSNAINDRMEFNSIHFTMKNLVSPSIKSEKCLTANQKNTTNHETR